MTDAYQQIKSTLKGVMTALVTPMKPDGSVDYDTLAQLIDWQIDEGVNALVAVGTTGEAATLAIDEHIDVIRFCEASCRTHSCDCRNRRKLNA